MDKMTSTNKRDGGEVELLPLPDAELSTDMHIDGHGDEAYSEDQMQAYARANVERALAESRAQEAESFQKYVDANEARIEAEARAAESRAEVERLRGLLTDWHTQASNKNRRVREQSPGHSHEVLGVWDSDNGTFAGVECAQCALWFEAARLRAALSLEPTP